MCDISHLFCVMHVTLRIALGGSGVFNASRNVVYGSAGAARYCPPRQHSARKSNKGLAEPMSPHDVVVWTAVTVSISLAFCGASAFPLATIKRC